jgi:glycosyltransferase involved in cell wall biosynthesis
MDGCNSQGALVSIVVRTKDRPKLLAEALASIAEQTHRPIEAVVVNDGGEDVSGVADAFAERLDTKLVDLQPGRGRSSAANAGISAVRGSWIGFLDDDDLLVPHGVATLLEASARMEVVPYGRVDAYFQPDGAAARSFRVFSRAFDLDALLFENFIPINACLIPTEILRGIGGMDERLDCFEDWDLFLRLSDRVPFRHVDRLVAEYRIFDQAFITGRGGQERQHRGRVAIFTKHAHRYTPEALSRMQFAVKTEMGRMNEDSAAEAERLRAELRECETHLEEIAQTLRALEGSRGWRAYQRARRLLGRR